MCMRIVTISFLVPAYLQRVSTGFHGRRTVQSSRILDQGFNALTMSSTSFKRRRHDSRYSQDTYILLVFLAMSAAEKALEDSP